MALPLYIALNVLLSLSLPPSVELASADAGGGVDAVADNKDPATGVGAETPILQVV
jgi:hypothetical protein